MEDQQYVLRWHYHETTLLSGLPKLLDSELLTDITLSVGCHNIKAHRVVLATCSAYFLQLFQDMGPLQHPVIILQDTDYNDLTAIISFIYRGQCLVSEKQLPSVLAAAKLLQIRGLCDLKVPESKSHHVNTTKDLQIMSINANNDSTNQQCVIREELKNNQVPVVKISDKLTNVDNSQEILCQSKSSTYDNILPMTNNKEIQEMDVNEEDNLATQWKTKGNNSSKCFICGKYLSNQYNLRVHMETHEDGYHACSSCPHVSRSRDALRKHISYRHPDENTSRKRKSKLDL